MLCISRTTETDSASTCSITWLGNIPHPREILFPLESVILSNSSCLFLLHVIVFSSKALVNMHSAHLHVMKLRVVAVIGMIKKSDSDSKSCLNSSECTMPLSFWLSLSFIFFCSPWTFYFTWSLLPFFQRILSAPLCVSVAALPPMLKANSIAGLSFWGMKDECYAARQKRVARETI